MPSKVAFAFSIILSLIYIFLKRKYSLVGSFIVLAMSAYITPIAMPYFEEEGVNAYTIGELLNGIGVVAVIVGLPIFVIGAYFKEKQENYERKNRNQRNGKNCCPKCGRTSIHYIQPHLEKKQYGWDDDEYTIEQVNGYWKCTFCKYSWWG